jgi:bifunctional non-homologous end joining protein LigD
MGLNEYKKKRDFGKTPEPAGKVGRSKESALRFVIQKHDASRLHYDFRLEYDGVLKSWAVPKGPSLDPSHKSLAVQVEDHPLDYGDFEGVIPEGQYGGGTVLLWDTGTWQPLHDPGDGFASGRLHFILNGEKLHGEWSLIRMGGKAGDGGKNWLLMKLKDKYASTKDILKNDKSVKTSRSLKKIADERDDVWSAEAKEIGAMAGAKKAALPATFSPQFAVLADAPPKGDQWLHEIKFDGYRMLARISSGDVQLSTRNDKNWTSKFPRIAAELEKLKVDSAILDGEIVVLDKEGRSDFQGLQGLLKDKIPADPVYMVFDMPFCNGIDLREVPLIERKERLRKIFDQSPKSARIRFSDHIEGDGSAVIEKACHMHLEGIISKRRDASYVSRRDPSWLKSKCIQRQEFVVIGYTPPQGSRTGFGSLLLGYHGEDGELKYAGRVGTGFDNAMLAKTFKQLRELEQDQPPTATPPPPRERRNAHWIKPSLVAEVKFSDWTRDGMLRHPAFVAFRTDKPQSQIVREVPVDVKKVEKEKKARPKRHAAAQPPDSSTDRESKAKNPAAAPRRGAGSSNVSSKSATTIVAGITISHPDKVLYPEAGYTKRDVAEYYELVAEWMLPHIADRPLALVRCPGGVGAKCFFQRNWSNTLPAAIDKVNIGEGKKREYHVALHDLAGIISLAQMGVLEIHTWNCRGDDIEHPDQIIFDLDPGPDLPWKKVVDATRRVRAELQGIGLEPFLKTSGGKGLHLTIPIVPNIDWDAAKNFSGTIARSLAERDDLFVANMRKDLRGGKVYIDFNRNGRTATAVAPYSTRARQAAGVSMPISWEEIGKLPSADHFTVETARRYLDRRSTDPWKEFGRSRVDLLKLLKHSSAA